jgi:hypothetical protein
MKIFSDTTAIRDVRSLLFEVVDEDSRSFLAGVTQVQGAVSMYVGNAGSHLVRPERSGAKSSCSSLFTNFVLDEHEELLPSL